MCKNFTLKIIWSERETLSPLLFHLPPFVLYFNIGKIVFEKIFHRVPIEILFLFL